MPFRESGTERKIGGKEAPKDIEAIKNKLKKFPIFPKLLDRAMDTLARHALREYTRGLKKKYPETIDYLKKSVQGGGFVELFISPKEGHVSVLMPHNSIVISEEYLSKFKKLKDFTPEFLDESLKHTLGNIKEEIPGHEGEHLKGLALKTHLKKPNIDKEDFYAEIQRISKEHSRMLKQLKPSGKTEEVEKSIKEGIVNAIASPIALWLALHFGIEEFLKLEVNKEGFFKLVSEPPTSKEIKGMFPYLKEEITNGGNNVFERFEEIRKDLREKYEEKYGKIGEGKNDT